MEFVEEPARNASGRQSSDRVCSCGRSFRGASAHCLPCRKARRTRERECECGVVFIGDRSKCSHCLSIEGKAYYEQNKNRIAAKYRDEKFNLTPGWYASRFEELGGRCPACGQEEVSGRALSVDHDHACCPGDGSCGQCVRDLLCVKCNSILGMAGDSADVLMQLVGYLLQHHPKSGVADQPVEPSGAAQVGDGSRADGVLHQTSEE